MKSSRWQNHFSFLFFVFTVLNTLFVFAGPSRTTYQAKIIKPDGYPLEAASVNFKFTILDPAGACILYSETYSAVNMNSTGGLISFSLGSGVKTYPVSSPTFEDVFSNITPSLSCDVGGPVSYSPSSNDIRKIVMQFHDGAGWQTLPAMNINAVPYAMYANDAQKLGGVSATAFVQDTEFPTCITGEALHYNGTSFTCVNTSNVSAAAVVAALGYTPATGASVTAVAADVASVTATVASVSSSVFSVSSTVSSLATSVSSLQSSTAASFAAITSSQWVTSGTELFYSSGFVGIGTTNPSRQLDVYASSGSASVMGLRTNDYSLGSSGTTMTFQFGAITGNTYASINALTGGGVAAGNLVLQSGIGNVGIGTTTPVTKLEVSGGVRISMETAACAVSYAGTLRYNAGLVEYCNGTSWSAFGVAGAGITLVNGSASGTQTFVTGISGTNFGITTSNGVHTFNVPLAASGSVTAGLLSNADYVTFSNKMNATSAAVNAALGYTPANQTTVATSFTTVGSSFTAVNSSLANLSTSMTSLGASVATNASNINSVSATVASLSSNTAASFAAITSSQWVTSGTSIYYSTGDANLKRDHNGQTLFNIENANNDTAVESKVYLTAGETNGHLQVMAASHSSTTRAARLSLHSNGTSSGVNIIANSATGDIRLYTQGYSSFTYERMRVTSTGVGIKTGDPTARLHIAAGSATLAPLKIASGPLLTAPQSGTIEYDGSRFYLTDDSSVRRSIATGSTSSTIDNISTIGIGTNNPQAPLHIVSSNPNGITIERSSAMNSHILYKNSLHQIYAGMSPDGYFAINNTDNLESSPTFVATASKTVGIGGVTAPKAALDVLGAIRAGTGNATGGIDILYARYGSTSETTGAIGARYSTGGLILGYGVKAGTDGTNPYLSSYDNSNTQRSVMHIAGDIEFLTAPAQTTAPDLPVSMTQRMVITEVGNVGIGVSVPTSTLQVAGDITAAGGPGAVNLKAGAFDHTYTQFFARTASPTTRSAYVGVPSAGSLNFNIINEMASGNLVLGTNGGERARIDSSGNFGIGVSNPAQVLDVLGTIKFGADNQRSGLLKSVGSGLTPNPGSSGFGAIIEGAYEGHLVLDLKNNQANDAIAFRYSAAANMAVDTVGFVMNGQGNFGLGTSNPTQRLTVRAVHNTAAVSSYTGALLIHDDPNNVAAHLNAGVSYNGGNQHSWVQSNGVSGVYALALQPAGGNIGIGTAVPNFKVTISGASVANGSSQTTINAFTGNGVNIQGSVSNSSQDAITYQGGGSGGGAAIAFRRGGSYDTYMDFYTNNTAASGAITRQMTLTNTGQLGIGVTPTLKFEVGDGNGYLKSQTSDGGLELGSGNDESSYIDFRGSANLAADYRGRIEYSDTEGMHFNVNGNAATAMFIASSTSYVGIGTVAPSGNLHVYSSNAYSIISNQNAAAGGQNWRWYSSSTGAPLGSDAMCFGVGTCILTVLANGNGSLSGVFTHASDARLKREITSIPYALDKVTQIDGVTYYWKDSSKDSSKQMGLIAQQVEKVFPELVKTNAEGIKSVAYQNLVAPIINALKEIREWMFKTDERVQTLEKENALLKERLDRLEKSINEKK